MVIAVLLIDDDDDEYLLTRDLLEQTGGQQYRYRLEHAHSAGEARLLLQTQVFDAYLVDYRLGMESGLELVRELVALTPGTPGILLTGVGDWRIDLAAMDAGAADYLNKAELTPGLLDHALRYALERARAAEQLGASEAFHRSLVELSPDLIGVHQGGTLVYINPAGARLLGSGDAAALLDRPVRAFLAAEAMQEAVTSSPVGSGEEPALWQGQPRLRRLDGSDVDVEVSSAVVQYRGKPARLVLARDTSVQVHATESLRFQATLLESVEQAVIATDLEGTILYWNRFAERLYGWAAGEVLGRNSADVILGGASTEQAIRIVADLRAGNSWSGEFTVQRRDEVAFPAHVTNSPIHNGTGRLVGLVGISYDLSEYKAAEAALRRSEARFRAMFEFSPDLLCIAGLDGYFTNVNPAFESTLGWAPEELLAQPYLNFVHPEDRPTTIAAVTRLGHGTVTIDFENRWRTSAGEYRILSWRSTPAPDEGLIYSVARDVTEARQAVTERRALQRRFDESEKLRALGQLAAGVAHDVNNALATIMGPLEMLRATFAHAGRATPLEIGELDIVLRAAEDAADTVRRLQAFARPKQQAEEQEWESVRPDDLLAAVIAFTRPRWRDQASAEGRRISVVAQPGDAPTVQANPAELREALVNLVNNACDALPTGGTITLTSSAKRDPQGSLLAIITVADTGIGMDEPTRRRIFEPFFTTKSIGHGTGLGLAMVHGTVSRFGGAIDVSSRPGLGTIVTIRLPASSAERSPHHHGTAPGPAVSSRRRVLLVEDEAILRVTARRILEAGGHVVVDVDSAEAALALLREREAFEIVVTDVGLPGLSGWQLVAQLRVQSPALPVIVASGWVTDGDAAMATEAGIPANRLIGKPYRATALLAAVQRAGQALDAPDGSYGQ